MRQEADGEPVKLLRSLEDARVTTLPPAAYYIPNFITAEDEALLLNRINTVPLPRWTHLTRRRLQTWPSALSSTNTLLASPLPTWLTEPIFQRFRELGFFADSPHGAPNHCLINEYKPGQGIMPHEDGAAYYPVVATVSLGSATVLDVYGKQEGGEIEQRPRYRILQEKRSLLVTTEELYTGLLHGIKAVAVDESLGVGHIANWNVLGCRKDFENGTYERSTRVSLTFRDVLKVKKVGAGLKFMGKQ